MLLVDVMNMNRPSLCDKLCAYFTNIFIEKKFLMSCTFSYCTFSFCKKKIMNFPLFCDENMCLLHKYLLK